MTATSAALESACHQAGFSAEGASLLRAHSASVYLLPKEKTVARISRDEHEGLRAKTSVALTHWLVAQGFPATEPVLDHAIDVDETTTVTFWRHYPQSGHATPPARELGRILKQLHALPAPPFNLPKYRPLVGLTLALESPTNSLPEGDWQWLTDRATELIDRYHELDSELGTGFVHGDAYSGNTLWGPDGVLLGDWDEASIAPRELDLANTYQRTRFGETEAELDAFADAYGWDIRAWDGFAVLRGMRDLHTLASYIRRSATDWAAAAELRLRVRSLRDPATADTWHAG